MPVFKYIAINNNGVRIKGNIEADNILIAMEIIYQREWCLLKIKIREKVSSKAHFLLF